VSHIRHELETKSWAPVFSREKWKTKETNSVDGVCAVRKTNKLSASATSHKAGHKESNILRLFHRFAGKDVSVLCDLPDPFTH
jgi:hypothetical protein